MSPSWKRDPDTGEWSQVEREAPPAACASEAGRWAPGPNAGWRRAGESRCRASLAKRLLWWLVIAIPAAVAILIVEILMAGKGFDYGR